MYTSLFHIVLAFLAFVVPVIANGQVLLNEKYTGDVYYIQNTLNISGNCCCINEIFVNEQLLLVDLQTEGIELDLSSSFKHGSEIAIHISHDTGCAPVIKKYSIPVKIISTQINQGKLKFDIKSDSIVSYFDIEIFNQGKWKIVKSRKSNGTGSYSISIHKFVKQAEMLRVVSVTRDGRKVYSGTILLKGN